MENVFELIEENVKLKKQLEYVNNQIKLTKASKIKYKNRVKKKDEIITKYIDLMDEYVKKIKRLENKINVLEHQLSKNNCDNIFEEASKMDK